MFFSFIITLIICLTSCHCCAINSTVLSSKHCSLHIGFNDESRLKCVGAIPSGKVYTVPHKWSHIVQIDFDRFTNNTLVGNNLKHLTSLNIHSDMFDTFMPCKHLRCFSQEVNVSVSSSHKKESTVTACVNDVSNR